MNVFAKIFAQIFDSSIAEDYLVRHVFMDLLVLADRDGVVDMTVDAIARRTNVPVEIVATAIDRLKAPDSTSRSPLEEGARLVLLDSHRDWGWQIVNYDHYRQIRDEESRKAYFRDYKRDYRSKHASKKSTSRPTMSTPVLDSPHLSTEGEGDIEGEEEKAVILLPAVGGQSYPISQKQFETWKSLYLGVDVMAELRKMVGWLDANKAKRKTMSGMLRFANSWLSKAQDYSKLPDQKRKKTWRTGDPKKASDWEAAQIPFDEAVQ